MGGGECKMGMHSGGVEVKAAGMRQRHGRPCAGMGEGKTVGDRPKHWAGRAALAQACGRVSMAASSTSVERMGAWRKITTSGTRWSAKGRRKMGFPDFRKWLRVFRELLDIVI